MELKEAQADHKARSEAVVKRLNEVIAMQQQLAAERQQLTEEALKLNGEARLLKQLSDNGQQPQDPEQK